MVQQSTGLWDCRHLVARKIVSLDIKSRLRILHLRRFSWFNGWSVNDPLPLGEFYQGINYWTDQLRNYCKKG